jgi:hypothetical protein
MSKTNRNGEKQKRNTEGLKPPWRKGQSGNPKGRPKRSESVTQWIHELSQQVDTDGMMKGQLVAEAVYAAALSGDMRAAKLILDRIEPTSSGVTINNGIGIGQSGLSLIESIRSDPQRFRDMLKANGIDRSGDSLLDSEGE